MLASRLISRILTGDDINCASDRQQEKPWEIYTSKLNFYCGPDFFLLLQNTAGKAAFINDLVLSTVGISTPPNTTPC